MVRFVRFGRSMVVGNTRLLSGGGARWFYHSGALFFHPHPDPHPHPHPHPEPEVWRGRLFYIFSKFLAVFLIFFIL